MLKCRILIDGAEFKEAGSRQMSTELFDIIQNAAHSSEQLEKPSFLNIDFAFENMRGISDIVDLEKQVWLSSAKSVISLERGYPRINLAICVEIPIGNFVTSSKFEEWFNGHDDRKLVVIISICNQETEEEYFANSINDVQTKVD